MYIHTYKADATEKVWRNVSHKLIGWSGVGHGSCPTLVTNVVEEGEVRRQRKPGWGRRGERGRRVKDDIVSGWAIHRLIAICPHVCITCACSQTAVSQLKNKTQHSMSS